MRFKKIVMILVFGLIFGVFALTRLVHAQEAFRVWGCTDFGWVGSWCQTLPGGGNNWHNTYWWNGWYDSYGCNGNFIGTYSGLSNRQTCETHGGPYGGCCSVMGTGIFPHDCFASGDDGCGPMDYGSLGCGEVQDVRTEEMKDGQCCPIALCDDYKNLGRFPNADDKVNVQCETDVFVRNPVNVATGNKYEEVLDVKVSTPGIPLEFRRAYNSKLSHDGPLGYGWNHNYGLSVQVLQEGPPKRVIVWNSDGRALYFKEISRATEILFAGESGVKDRLKQVIATGEYFLRRKEGNLTYKFNSYGKLIQLSDPNGNTLTLGYDGSNRLTQVANNFGKTLVIHYNGNHIDYIQDPKGQSIQYRYENGNGNLTKVIYPDTNSITYAYSNHDLTDKYDTNNTLFGHWGYDNRHRVTNYYSHVKDSVNQEEINLTYLTGSTELRRTIGTQTYLTTYTTAVIDGISVVEQIEGCSTCGGVNKHFQYSDRLDLTHVTTVDGSNAYTTQYIYDTPPNPWEQVGDVLHKTEALGWGLPWERTTDYVPNYRADDPFILNNSTETKPSVVANCPQNKIITINYYPDGKGNIESRVETGCVLIDGALAQRTYTTSYQYNAFGQITQINGPRADLSDITTFEYYGSGVPEVNNRYQLRFIVNALGQTTEFSQYDANGNVGKIKDPNNVETQYTYDERNRIKTITNLSTIAQTQYFYDPRGNLDYVILPEGNQIDFTYNPANKLTQITDSLGNKIIYGYDTEGNRNREEIKDPQGVLKKYLDFTYNEYDRLKKITNPDTNNTEYWYDGRGNRVTFKEPKDSQPDVNNPPTNPDYDRYVYDPLNRLTDINQPLSINTHYGYDTQDNQTSVRDPNGYTTSYVYDDFGRKNQTTSPDTGVTKYQYDPAGNLTQKVDAKCALLGCTINYTYDALNRLTAIQFPSDPTQNISFTYDSISVTYAVGRLTGRTDPSGSYTFHYYPDGRLKKEEKTITGGGSYTTQYEYNKNGVLTKITYPTGRIITYVPDAVEKTRISQVSTTLNGQPKDLASGIAYLPFGGITGLTYGNGLTLNQAYDDPPYQYRYWITSIAVGSILNLTYGYDPNGNITSILDVVNPPGGPLEFPGTYSYQPGTNKLTNIQGTPSINYGYDSNGNITTENAWTYVYDLSNQLIRALEGGYQVGGYTFNGAGQRVKKVVAGGTTRIFHYDLWGHIIAETNQYGGTLAEYVYLGDQLLAMIKPGEQAYYFHNDHLGTPRVLTDATQAVVWKAAYTPFGEAVTSIATVENPFRFPGQYYDAETGLHYNYFRYYNPPIGRYLTPDPIGLEGGINLFSYVAGNPVNRRDRRGLDGKGKENPQCDELKKSERASCCLPFFPRGKQTGCVGAQHLCSMWCRTEFHDEVTEFVICDLECVKSFAECEKGKCFKYPEILKKRMGCD